MLIILPVATAETCHIGVVEATASQWDDNARAIGLRVDRSPEPGAIAVSNSGYYGHVMYVESVNDDGTFNISQYNASWDGRYSVRYNVSVGSLVFIHF
jgi:surface antigen